MIDKLILSFVLDRARDLSLRSAGRFLVRNAGKGAPSRAPVKIILSDSDKRKGVVKVIMVYTGRGKWEGRRTDLLGQAWIGGGDENGLIPVRFEPEARRIDSEGLRRIFREELGLVSLSEWNRLVKQKDLHSLLELKHMEEKIKSDSPGCEYDLSPEMAADARRFSFEGILEDVLLPICGLCGRAVRPDEQYISVGVGMVHLDMEEGEDPDYIPSERYHLICVKDARSGHRRRVTPVYRALKEAIGVEVQQENCARLLQKLGED